MNFPFIATLVLLFGLFGLVLSLFLSAWRYRARVTAQTDPNLPPNLQEEFGPRLTSQRLRWVRWAFALIVLTALGFHFYWGLFSTGPLGADADFAGLKARRDQRNRRENESTLRGWIFDRHKDTRRALAKYRYLNGEIKRDYPLGAATSHIIGFATLVRGEDGLERAVAAPPPPKDEKSWWQKLTDFSSEPPRPPVGQDLTLTIDFDLQRAAAEQLQNRRGAIVMLNPQTGEILAMASSPGFDPDDVNNDPTWAKLQSDVANKPMLNRAINEYYLPGSTLKTLTAAAGIDARMDDKVYVCRGGGWTPPGSGRPIRDDDGHEHGSIGLLEAYTVSCNQYFAQLGAELERQRMGEAADRFGLKVFDTGVQSLRAGFAPDFWNTENAALFDLCRGQNRHEIRFGIAIHRAGLCAVDRFANGNDCRSRCQRWRQRHEAYAGTRSPACGYESGDVAASRREDANLDGFGRQERNSARSFWWNDQRQNQRRRQNRHFATHCSRN
jgi:hypothetical protein